MNEIMSGGQMLKFLTILKQKGTTFESVQRAIESGLVADVFDPEADFMSRDNIRAMLRLSNIFRFNVGYHRTFDEMIDAAHLFYVEGLSNFISAYIPILGNFESRYFFSSRYHSAYEAIKAMEAGGWVPAKFEHLLSFAEVFPTEQSRCKILALGSLVINEDQEKLVPNLYTQYRPRDEEVEQRVLGSYRLDHARMDENARYLAVRNLTM